MDTVYAIIFVSFSTVAFATEGRLVGLNKATIVIVWRDKASNDEAMALHDAGVDKTNPALLMRLIACIVPSGTRAIITSAGFATHDIMVIEGQHSGCRGNVVMEMFKLQ
jgi:dihydrodipicolinate reductase